MVKHIAFTMYPVKDMKRARRFYEKALGLKLTCSYEDKWVEYHLGGACFAITTMAPKVKPRPDAGGISFEVKDVDAAVKKLVKGGGKVLEPAFDTGVCRMAYVRDTEGNCVGLHKKAAGR